MTRSKPLAGCPNCQKEWRNYYIVQDYMVNEGLGKKDWHLDSLQCVSVASFRSRMPATPHQGGVQEAYLVNEKLCIQINLAFMEE